VSRVGDLQVVVDRETRAEDPDGRSRSFEAVESRNRWHRHRIVGLTGPGIGLHRWESGHRTAGLFVGWCCHHHHYYRCMLSRQREGDGHICHARPEVVGGLTAGLAMLTTWSLGEVDWRRVGIETESRRPRGYVRL
jgi:hypothetical protein